MKIRPHFRKNGEKGYATLALVSSVSIVIFGAMIYTIMGSVRSLDAQARAQVKQDFRQKEDAILNALVHIVPNKAIGAMMQGSADNPGDYNWDAIFREALTLAHAEQSVSPQIINSLGLGAAISGNSGDMPYANVSDFVNAPVGTPAGGSNRVNGGNVWESLMLSDPRIASRVPAALALTQANYLLDKDYPIVSFAKSYTASHTKGLGLSPNLYPLYNLIQYPDVRFGYKRPGELFVAKRNWWVFSLEFGSHNTGATGIPPVRRDYVLSIYEIPSQVPLSASALLDVGRFADGAEWENVEMEGGIVAERLRTQGTVAISNGVVSARRSLDLAGQTLVDGTALRSDFDELGAREGMAIGDVNETVSDSDFYQASLGGNVGRVAFIPINRGDDTLLRVGDGARSERISQTGWNHYSMAGRQAQMVVRIMNCPSINNQTPTQIRLTYRNSSNGNTNINYFRGSNWPTELQPGGEEFPFQTATLENTRIALVVHLDRLSDFVAGLPNTGGIEENNSLYIEPRPNHLRVRPPSFPSNDPDLVVSFRGGQDLSAYTAGLSLVSRYRVYIADTLNEVSVPVPTGSGLPSGHVFHPPLSIFAPEKRFGESLFIKHPVRLEGQLNSLKTGNQTVNPLEFVGGSEDRVAANLISADLTSLKSPAELPPIHLMNWLVTIEPVH